MAGIKLFIIFLVVLVLDGLVLPAFFDLRESFLSLLILIVPVLYMGSTRRTVVYCLAFAFVSESLRGLHLGDLAIPFLFTALVIYLTQRFLDIKYTYDTRFVLGRSTFLAAMSVMFVYVFSFFFKQGDIIEISTYRNFGISSISPVVSATMVLEALILVFAFNVVFNKKSDYQ